ncbi:MAG TPA: hypothetical protein DDX98_15290 [Bacteroidales bacterium]|jgi:hypothetical protein|nr:hypothetical protein [Bacteroidales bacterium]
MKYFALALGIGLIGLCIFKSRNRITVEVPLEYKQETVIVAADTVADTIPNGKEQLLQANLVIRTK